MAVNACKGFFEGEVYGSIRHSEFFIARVCGETIVYRLRVFFFEV